MWEDLGTVLSLKLDSELTDLYQPYSLSLKSLTSEPRPSIPPSYY